MCAKIVQKTACFERDNLFLPIWMGKLSLSRNEFHQFLLFYTNLIFEIKLDLAFNNVKPKDWYFVLD